MSSASITEWTMLGIRYPACGNSGHSAGDWRKHASVPFKLVEDVIRSWTFQASRDGDGTLMITADTDTDEVDWESGTGMRLECMACFDEFPLPEKHAVDFE